ncbi:YdcF family protein [Lactobacillus johnsonii]|uniref:YdcF family protein n=1 Tax=Lactobacillus johnsonii TaxID=33959 RepID=UPI001C68D191|nr:YdcF family protein [Lactobacillus johnsonii]MBW8460172.1 YdcF family protein [Lactobacillus johnsonii]
MVLSFSIALVLFLLALGTFLWVLTHERRSLWSGMTLVWAIITFGLFTAASLLIAAEVFPVTHQVVLLIFVLILMAIMFSVVAFIAILIIMFIYDGIKILIREGNRWTNFLSLAMGIGIIAYLFLFPLVGKLTHNNFGTYVYLFINLVIIYLIFIMMMYTLTSWINLVNIKTKKLDYVVVLGAGLMGKRVTPLLAARINRGIEVYRRNPGSKIIMSGGQGPDEEIPEAVAMAKYAEEKGVPKKDIIVEDKSKTTRENLIFSHKLMKPDSRFAIVTNSYHVYRALVLAKRLGLQCIGYGAKTKWYFTLNAFVREFIAYLTITWRLQLSVVGCIGLGVIGLAIVRQIIR